MSKKGKPQNATLRVIGDRGAGKTTYMAALARWPNADSTSPVQTVMPFAEGQELANMAQNILEKGLYPAPTPLRSVTEIKDYGLKIVFKKRFSWKSINGLRSVTLNLLCKDYSGEFFIDLLHQQNSPLLRAYMEDCINAQGIIFLMDGNAADKENEYANNINEFIINLDRLSKEPCREKKIAVVLTKCEKLELWIDRQDPRKLVSSRFREVLSKLENWQNLGTVSVEYFAASAFGILGHESPIPNSKPERCGNITHWVLKEPSMWHPFGLVSPLYWLCTGERHPDLDED